MTLSIFCEMLWVDLHLLWLLQNCMTALHIHDSQRKQQGKGRWTFHDSTTGFLTKWHVRSEHINSILMTCSYPDLESASDWSCRVGNLLQPIRSTTRIWIVTHHQYGMSALVSHTSHRGETSDGITKCWPFSQAVHIMPLIPLVCKSGVDILTPAVQTCYTN